MRVAAQWPYKRGTTVYKIALYEWSFLIIGMVFGESGGTVAL